MAISFNHMPADPRVPLFYVEIDGSAAAGGGQSKRALVIGPMLAAGTASAEVPVQVSTPEAAAGLFGRGSYLHRFAVAYFAQGGPELWALPVDEDGSGVAAEGTVTFTGPATEAGTLAFYIAGQRVLVSVADEDTATDICAAFVAAVQADTNLPISAAVNGVDAFIADITARTKGANGNAIDVRLNYYATDSIPAGVGVAVVEPADGATDPDITDALAALGDERFAWIGCIFNDTANLNALSLELGDDVTGRWGPTRRLYGHGFTVMTGTQGGLSSAGNARNDHHLTIFGIESGSPAAPWEVLGAAVGRLAQSIALDPARPLHTLPLSRILAPPAEDRFNWSERNTLLTDGISPLTVDRTGTVRLSPVITVYQTNALGAPDQAFLAYTTLATLELLNEELESAITGKFGRHKLASDGARFGAGQAIVTPGIIRAEILSKYLEWELRGLVENFDLFAEHLVVERNALNPNRVDCLFPPDLVNQFEVFACLNQFRLQYSGT